MLIDAWCMDGWGMGGMSAWMLGWTLFAVLVLAALSAGVIWLMRRSSGAASAVRAESADQILQRRLASGEIDQDEYLRMRAAMKD